GTETARSRKRTFPSAEGHRTRSGGQVSWLRILAAPRLPGYPVATNWSGSPLQWRDRAGFAALRDPTILKLPPQAAHRTSLLLPATRSTHPTRYEVWLRLYGRLARRSRWCTGSVDAKDFPPSFGVSFVCGLPAGHVFVRSQVAESLVGPDVIVGLFPVTEEDVVGVQPLQNLLQVIEFLLMRPMGAFHMAIEPRGARREHKQFDPERGARRFERRLEFRPPINLDRPDRKPKPGERLSQHPRRRLARLPLVGGQHVLPAHHVPRREVNPAQPREDFDRRRIDLHQIPRRLRNVPPREPLRIRPRAAPAPPGARGPDDGWLPQLAFGP